MLEFENAIAAAEQDMGCKGIGTLGEKSLHLALKYYFAPDPETHERQVGGFVADAVTETGIIEVQTRGLSRLKPKLDAFLPICPVTVVHPVITDKLLLRVDENGELLSQRKSPKHETVYSAMREIYTLRDYLEHPHFSLCICELELAEYSVQHGRSRREKLDRVPLALRGERRLETPADYAALLPDALAEPFTVPETAALLHTTELSARLFLNLLHRMGIVAEAGRNGRLKCWQRTGFCDIRR